MVSIARALSNADCKVLILDEPTSALTGADTERLFEIVRRLSTAGVTVLYISHFLEEVERIASEYTVLRDGRSVAAGRVARYDAQRAGVADGGSYRDRAVPSRSPRTAGETVLEVRELSGRRLPQQASLSLRRGEVVGIAGPGRLRPHRAFAGPFMA